MGASNVLAGATQDPSDATYETSLYPCTDLTPVQATIVSFVSGPQKGACYVGCRYGTNEYALKYYWTSFSDQNLERPIENIFATSTTKSGHAVLSLDQKMQLLTKGGVDGLCHTTCPLAAW